MLPTIARESELTPLGSMVTTNPPAQPRHTSLFSSLLGSELPRQQITAVQLIEGGFRVIGWARPKTYVVISDGTGTVVGLGRHLPAGQTHAIPIPEGHTDDVWVAFAGPTFLQDEVRAYPLLR